MFKIFNVESTCVATFLTAGKVIIFTSKVELDSSYSAHVLAHMLPALRKGDKCHKNLKLSFIYGWKAHNIALIWYMVELCSPYRYGDNDAFAY